MTYETVSILIHGILIVYLLLVNSKYTVMSGAKNLKTGKRKISSDGFISISDTKKSRFDEFSPSWVVVHAEEGQRFKIKLIDRIREGVKKSEWKDLISYLESTEKEFAEILPTSISSMQKKEVYDQETSERIYEVARLFGLGFEVFDTKADFKNWLMTPSRVLGDKKPFELLDSSLGFELVENEIVRIQYNVYS